MLGEVSVQVEPVHAQDYAVGGHEVQLVWYLVQPEQCAELCCQPGRAGRVDVLEGEVARRDAAEVGRVHVGAALEQEAHDVQVTPEDPVKQRVLPGDRIGIMDSRAALGVQLPESNKVGLLGRVVRWRLDESSSTAGGAPAPGPGRT